MTDFKLLEQKIGDSHLSMTALSALSGVKRETLYNRRKGIGEYTASEIVGLTRALHLTREDRDAIFLG